MSDDYALRAIAIEECPDTGLVDASKPDDMQSSSDSTWAKLKLWLHID
jgi:hypothetical protein